MRGYSWVLNVVCRFKESFLRKENGWAAKNYLDKMSVLELRSMERGCRVQNLMGRDPEACRGQKKSAKAEI